MRRDCTMHVAEVALYWWPHSEGHDGPSRESDPFRPVQWLGQENWRQEQRFCQTSASNCDPNTHGRCPMCFQAEGLWIATNKGV